MSRVNAHSVPAHSKELHTLQKKKQKTEGVRGVYSAHNLDSNSMMKPLVEPVDTLT